MEHLRPTGTELIEEASSFLGNIVDAPSLLRDLRMKISVHLSKHYPPLRDPGFSFDDMFDRYCLSQTMTRELRAWLYEAANRNHE